MLQLLPKLLDNIGRLDFFRLWVKCLMPDGQWVVLVANIGRPDLFGLQACQALFQVGRNRVYVDLNSFKVVICNPVPFAGCTTAFGESIREVHRSFSHLFGSNLGRTRT